MNHSIIENRFLEMAKKLTLRDIAVAIQLLADVSTNAYCTITPDIENAIDDAFDDWLER